MTSVKNLIRIVSGVRIAGLLLVSACGGGTGGASQTPTSPSTNRNPTVSSLIVSPSFGVSSLTPFALNASASDPDGDALTYRWTFGANTATGASALTSINGDGATSVTVTVTDGRGGSATDSRTVTLGTLTGQWLISVAGCGTFNAPLTQSGGSISGTFVMPTTFCNASAGSTGRTDPAEPGTIDAAGKVQIRFKVGVFLDFYVRGQMDSTGRRITGGAFNSGFTGDAATMTKQ